MELFRGNHSLYLNKAYKDTVCLKHAQYLFLFERGKNIMFSSMKEKLKSKVIKRSKDRGITFSDRSLFEVGSKFRYIITGNKVCIIEASQFEQISSELGIQDAKHYEGTISKKGLAHIPLIDIRRKDALQALGHVDSLVVDIYEEFVVVQGYEVDAENAGVSNVAHIAVTRLKKAFTVRMEKTAFEQVAGEQIQLFDSIAHKEIFTSIKGAISDVGIPLKVASFFAGSGLLDESFRQSGFDIMFALEKDAAAAQTYVHNQGAHIMCEDICNFDGRLLSGIPVIIGGPPCQGFSNSNRHTNFLNNPNNLLMREYIRVIRENPSCQIFIIENVPQLLTAGDGQFLKEIIHSLEDFQISYGVLNAADYGSSQLRKRAIIIGSKIGEISLPQPVVAPEEYKTVGEALEGVHDLLPNQMDYSLSHAKTIERMQHIPQGANWKALPTELQQGFREGRTHSSIFKRLHLNKPSITITNVRKSLILHPLLNRVLSVRECARLFDLRDDYVFKGNLGQKQTQIANSVPIALGKAIAQAIKHKIGQFLIAHGFSKPQLV